MKPILKWAGGKTRLTPFLLKLWNNTGNMPIFEPFCGGSAFSLSSNMGQVWINDLNPHLINFYKCVQNGLSVPGGINFASMKSVYYENRDLFNDYIDKNNIHGKEQALLFYYLNRTCFNGLCRFNKKGKFNVPFGIPGKAIYKSNFNEYQYLMEDWVITDFDFRVCSIDDTPYFTYIDPPYFGGFTSYIGEFTMKDSIELVEWAGERPGLIVVSGPNNDFLINLYKKHGFSVTDHNAIHVISSKGSNKRVKEMIAIKDNR